MGWTAMIRSDFFLTGGSPAESVTWKQSPVETEALTKGLKFMTFQFFLTMKSWDISTLPGAAPARGPGPEAIYPSLMLYRRGCGFPSRHPAFPFLPLPTHR